jgi:hypothetical protein
MEVEPAALRHGDQRRAARPVDGRPVASAQHHAVDDPLHDGLDLAGKVAKRSSGHASPTGLVARERRLVDEQDAGASAGEVDRRRGPGGTGSDHEHVDALHAAILRAAYRGGQRSLLSHRRRTVTRGADLLPFGLLTRRSTDAASFE